MYTSTSQKATLVNVKGQWVNPYLIAAIEVWVSYTDTDSDDRGARIILADTVHNNVIYCERITPTQVVEIIRSALDGGGT